MVGIRFNGEFIKLNPGTKVSLQYNNPVFDNEILQGDYSLPVNIPYKGNAKQFGFSHEMHGKYRQLKYNDVGLYFKHTPISRGIMDINSITDDTISASMRLNISGLTAINEKLKSFDYGPDIDMGADMSAVIAFMKTQAALSYPTATYNFPMIFNPDFYEGNNPDYGGVVNFFSFYLAAPNYLDNTAANVQVITPMVYLHHIIKAGFAFNGYTVDDTIGFMNSGQQNAKIIIYNNRALDDVTTGVSPNGMKAKFTTNTTLPYNTEYPIIFGTEVYDSLNAHDDVLGEYTIQAAGSHTIKVHLNISALMPVNRTDYVTIRLYKNGVLFAQDTTSSPNIRALGNFDFSQTYVLTAGDVGQKITVSMQIYNSIGDLSTARLTANSYWSVNDLGATGSINTFQKVFNLRDHVPDITFGELLSAFATAFRFTFQFNHMTKTVAMPYFDNLLTGTGNDYGEKSLSGHEVKGVPKPIKTLNWSFDSDDRYIEGNFKNYTTEDYLGSYLTYPDLNTALPPSDIYLNKFAYIKSQHQIYRCEYTTSYLWTLYADAYYPAEIDPDGANDVRPKLSPLMMHWTTVSGGSGLFPKIKQPGSSKFFDLGENPYGLHFFYYHGLAAHGTSIPYPTSSTTNIANNGDYLDGYGLAWNGENMLTYHGNYISMVNKGEQIIKLVKLSLVDLNLFDISKNIRLDNALFLIKDMKIEMGEDLHEAELTLIKVI